MKPEPAILRSMKVLLPVIIVSVLGMIGVTRAQEKESIPETIQRLERELEALKAKGLAPRGFQFPDNAAISIQNREGKEVAYIGSTTMESGITTVSNRIGREIIRIGSDAEGDGEFYARNRDGKEVAYIGADKQGIGLVRVQGAKVHDYADVFELSSRDEIIPGTVVSMAPDGSGLEPSQTSYDKRVVGVISGAGGLNPGMRVGSRQDGSTDLPVAMSGQVYVRVCNEGGKIEVGDLLVASSTLGIAMAGRDETRLTGSVVGKALEPWNDEHEGSIRMLVVVR